MSEQAEPLTAEEAERLKWLPRELERRHHIGLKTAPRSDRALLDAAQTMYAAVSPSMQTMSRRRLRPGGRYRFDTEMSKSLAEL